MPLLPKTPFPSNGWKRYNLESETSGLWCVRHSHPLCTQLYYCGGRRYLDLRIRRSNFAVQWCRPAGHHDTFNYHMCRNSRAQCSDVEKRNAAIPHRIIEHPKVYQYVEICTETVGPRRKHGSWCPTPPHCYNSHVFHATISIHKQQIGRQQSCGKFWEEWKTHFKSAEKRLMCPEMPWESKINSEQRMEQACLPHPMRHLLLKHRHWTNTSMRLPLRPPRRKKS